MSAPATGSKCPIATFGSATVGQRVRNSTAAWPASLPPFEVMSSVCLVTDHAASSEGVYLSLNIALPGADSAYWPRRRCEDMRGSAAAST